CGGGGDGGGDPSGGGSLDALARARISVDGVEIEAWLARTPDERARGLMLVSEDDVAPLEDGTPRGMLFVYDEDRVLSFFMRDTFVPLDLAYATADGRIAETHALEPLDETPVVASRPVRFALEARRGTFAAFGIGVGDVIEIP
ncbi:MAG: DUF192 domain-containing protein, partial [Thermodesulfobacteriota bacterium]